jgi:hypothetical protein
MAKGRARRLVSMATLAAALLTVPPSLSAQSNSKPITIFGVGRQNCAVATSNAKQAEAFEWVLGFFSGRNVGAGTTSGNSIGSNGIWAEIELYCKNNPTVALFFAAEQTYRNMQPSEPLIRAR